MSNKSDTTSIDNKDSEEMTEDEWYDEYGERLPNINRRRFLQTTAATGLAAATYGASNHPAVRDFSDHSGEAEGLPVALPFGAAAAGKALGLAGLVGGGVAIAGSVGNSIGFENPVGNAVKSTIDTAFGFLDDNDRSEVQQKDTLSAARISIAAGWQNIQNYQQRVLNGTKNQVKLTKDTATSEGIKRGVEQLDQGASAAQAQSEAEIGVQNYYLRLQQAVLEDWNAIFHRNQGIYDGFELDREISDEDVIVGDSKSEKQVTVDYQAATDSVDPVPDDWVDKDGKLYAKIELLNSETVEIPIAVYYGGDSPAIFRPDASGDMVTTSLSIVDTDGNLQTISPSEWSNVWNEIENQEQNVRNLVQGAVQDAAKANLSTKELLSVLDKSEINTRIEDGENVADLQTAHASLYGDTQTDPANKSVTLSDTDKDGKLTVEGENGQTKTIDSGKSNVVYTNEDDIPTDANGNRKIQKDTPFTAGSGTYVVDEKGVVRKVKQGQNVTPTRITKTTTNENGETVEEEIQSTGVQNTELTNPQVGDLQNSIDTIEESQEDIQNLVDELESGSGGGGFFDGGGVSFGIIAGLLAAFYLFRDDDDGNGRRRGSKRRNK